MSMMFYAPNDVHEDSLIRLFMFKRVLVCGGRDYGDQEKVEKYLAALGPSAVIEGGAEGADKYARNWALRYGKRPETYWADWDQHGKAAGPIRNREMLEKGKPDVVLAFPGGRGTHNMMSLALSKGVPVLRIRS